MAEIVDFEKLRIEWIITISEELDLGTYTFDLMKNNLLLVSVFCSSWDQVEDLRRQAEQAIRNREYPREITELK